ncbi:MAG: threonine ammonia-lyase [Acidimicrobiia bacterium]|nr:threonine ammonia-lyase [Acidimicrobiia bacterium]
MTLPVTISDVEAAAAAIRGQVVETPFPRASTLSEITGADVALKLESFQFTASFKERGALNRLLKIPADARSRGVIAASAGNHAQGVAHHAGRLGIPATIAMPETTPFSKITRTEMLGAEVLLRGETFADSYGVAQHLAEESGATFVPAFDDPAIIAGQGTVALEMLGARPDLEVIVVPVGGGGLISGVATVAKAVAPAVEVIGVQTETYPTMLAALGRAGSVPGGPTIAEGIAVEDVGALTREIVAALVDDIVVVSEQRVEEAMSLYLEIEKIVVEGAGAASLAALLAHPDRFRGRRCGLIVSGANVDLRVLSSVILRALARSGRIVRLRVEIPDRPGALAGVAQVVGAERGNIVDVAHHRDLPGVPLRDAILGVSVETRDRAHADAIVASLTAAGYPVTTA